MFGNPVLIKELRQRMRGGRTWWVLLAYLTVIVVTVSLRVRDVARQIESGYVSAVEGAGALGRDMFESLAWEQLLLGLVVAPALTTGAIALEREQRSLELLIVTRLNASAILWGKLASTISLLTLLALVTAPFMSVAFLLGGMAPCEFVVAYSVILGSTAFFAMIGLCSSALHERTRSATMQAYALGTGLVIAPWFVWLSSGGRAAAGWACLSPIFALGSGIGANWVAAPAPGIGWPLTLAIYAGLSIPMWIVACRAVGRVLPESLVPTKGGLSRASHPRQQRDRWPLPVCVINPVLQLELLIRLRRKPVSPHRLIWLWILRVIGILAYAWFAAKLGAKVTRASTGNDAWLLLGLLQLVVVCCLAPILTASACTVEREKGTLQHLVLSLLTGRQICRGKLLGGLFPLLYVAMIFAPLMVLCTANGNVSPLLILGTYAITATTALSLGVLGLGCSISCRRTGTAQAVAVAATLAILFVLPLFTAEYHHGETLLACINPFVAIVSLHDGKHVLPWAFHIAIQLVISGSALSILEALPFDLDR